ncbi:hypothetical protein P9386_04950 [Caldifermentibacillus hisashii]|uniref:hypothetical protein n=1 Tax=Caldifermentibacillus hisashii TaxID=996558 RepID=UPI002E1CAF28|nr:hypothetical protein [Caldifermentibacillus hisashii]
MTLIQGYELGGVLVAVSSDTRQVINIFGAQLPFVDSTGKTERITPYVIFAGGGTNRVVDEIRGRLCDRLESALFIADMVEPLQNVIDELVGSPSFSEELADDTTAQVLLAGFNADGSVGIIQYITGDDLSVHYRVVDTLVQQRQVIAPSEDHTEAIFNGWPEQPEISDISELPSAVIQIMARNQAAAFEADPETVSETLNYCVLFKHPQSTVVESFEGTLKLNE